MTKSSVELGLRSGISDNESEAEVSGEAAGDGVRPENAVSAKAQKSSESDVAEAEMTRMLSHSGSSSEVDSESRSQSGDNPLLSPPTKPPVISSSHSVLWSNIGYIFVGVLVTSVFFGFPSLWPKLLEVTPSRFLASVNNRVCVSKECTVAASSLITAMNSSADRCEDAYAFTCGEWIERFELPEDEQGWSISFDNIGKENRGILRRIMERYSCEDAKRAGASSADIWSIMNSCYFETCMDLKDRETKGFEPLMNLIQNEVPFLLNVNYVEEEENLGSAEKAHRLAQRISGLAMLRTTVLLDISISPSTISDAGEHVMWLSEGGTGMAYRSYEQPDRVAKYRTHMSNVLTLFNEEIGTYYSAAQGKSKTSSTGQSSSLSSNSSVLVNPNFAVPVGERVNRILALEMDLKSISLSPEDARDSVATTLPRSLKEVREMLLPAVDIDTYLWPFRQMFPSNVTITNDTQLILDSDTYLPKLSNFILNQQNASASLSQHWDWPTIHDYFLFRFLEEWGALLSSRWRLEFERYLTDVSGAEIPPRWRTCLTSGTLEWVLGRQFVKATDAEKAKEETERMVKFLIDAFDSRLAENDWMDETTRGRAREKLQRISYKISHPDWLMHDYDSYFRRFYGDPDPDAFSSYFNAYWHLNSVGLRYITSKMGRPKDPSLWHMYPQTVNAYYNPLQNEIVFPASILRPPFLYTWHKDATESQIMALKVLNYGGLGSVIAHELSHAFDDQGRHYDADGRLVDWWTPESAARFNERADCFKRQYSAYTLDLTVDGSKQTFNVSGELTLGENIADNGGAKISFLGMQLEFGSQLRSMTTMLPGLPHSAQELYFISFSHIWCGVKRDDRARSLILSDPHSPHRFRVEGVLHNMEEYKTIVKCAKPDDVCAVW